MSDFDIVSLDNGNVRAWLDQEQNFHIKAVDRFGDPVELSPEQLTELIASLARLRDKLEREEAGET